MLYLEPTPGQVGTWTRAASLPAAHKRVACTRLTKPPECSWKAWGHVARAQPGPWRPESERETSSDRWREASLQGYSAYVTSLLGTLEIEGSTVSGKSLGSLLVKPEEAEDRTSCYLWCLFPRAQGQVPQTGVGGV